MADPASNDSRSLFGKLRDAFVNEPDDLPELKETLRDAAERDLFDSDALNIMFGALQVSDMQVRDVMIPRTELAHLGSSDSLEDILGTVLRCQHSRYPVIGEDLDDIKGILHAKDMLPLILASARERDSLDIRDYIRPATVVPESKRLNVLLQEFRSTRNHMAVVVDEYGHIAGAVTIEDVLEQIVGEIEDEHDIDDESFIKHLGDADYTVKASTPIEDFNEYFELELSDDEFDTIGGLVLHSFGRLPKRSETTKFAGFSFEVLGADSRRLTLLRASRLDAS